MASQLDDDLYSKLIGSNATHDGLLNHSELARLLHLQLSGNSLDFSQILYGAPKEVSQSNLDNILTDATSSSTRQEGHPGDAFMEEGGNIDDEALPPEYRSAQRGKVCGHIFKKGEGVYRCRDCALDATCVFCDRCFHGSNHEGHDTSFALSGSGGGCCDCGDPEAWKVPIDCKYHSTTGVDTSHTTDDESAGLPITTPLPRELVDSITKTITTVMEFILQTFSRSYWKPYLPPDAMRFQPVSIPGDNAKNDVWAIILWNDEVHSFNDVIDVVSDAISVTRDESRRVAEAVDLEGRDIIFTGTDKERMRQMAAVIHRIGLDVTVQPLQFTNQEKIAGKCIEWLDALLSIVLTHPVKVNGITYEAPEPIVRQKICEILCSEPLTPISRMEDRYHLGPEGAPNVNEISSTPTRLDYLLLYDVKMWKGLRKTLHEFFIGTLIVSGDEFKRILAERFALCYTKLTEHGITIDREVDLSVISLSVQLFTVPTIARHLALDTTIISDMLLFLYNLFRADGGQHRTTRLQIHNVKRNIDDEVFASRTVFPPTVLPANLYTLKHSRTYGQVMHDMSYLLSNKTIRMELFQSNHNIMDLFRFVKLFAIGQGLDPQTRAITQHVEFEGDDWVNAFNLSLKMSQLMPYVAGCFAPFGRQDISSLEQALAYTASVLVSPAAQTRDNIADASKWSLINSDGEFGPYIIPRYQVSTKPISLHHPLHWFLSLLLNYLPVATKNRSDGKDVLVRALTSQFPTNPAFYSVPVGFDKVSVTKTEILSLVFEEPLRVMAMLAQVQAGLWVRNGYMLRAQTYHYEELELREEGHDQDMFLLQTAVIALGPDRFMLQALHRFELWDWLVTPHITMAMPPGFDKTKFGLLAEDFLRMLIIMLTERALCCMGLDGFGPENEIRRELIHHLGAAKNGLPHSAVIARVPDRLVDPHELNDGLYSKPTRSVDDILADISNFKYPEGVTDQGLYELKSQYYEQIDPWFWHYTREQRQKIDEILRNRMENSKSSNIKNSWIPIPRIIPIPPTSPFGDLLLLTSSSLFIRIVFNCIAITTMPHIVGSLSRPFRNENLLSSALHLVMIGLSDPRTRDEFSRKVAVMTLSDSPTSPTFLKLVTRFAEQLGVGSLQPALIQSQREEFSDQLGRVEWIIDQLSQTLATQIAEWRARAAERQATSADQHQQQTVDRQATNSTFASDTILTEAERKKQAAKARQAAIMAQFAKQQKSFMDKHSSQMDVDDVEDERDGEEDDDAAAEESSASAVPMADDERIWEFPKDNCIVCQEPTSGRLYGTLCLLQKSSMLRQVDFADIDNVMDVLNKVQGSLDSGPLEPADMAIPTSPGTPSGSKSAKTSGTSTSGETSKPFQAIDYRLAEAGFFISTCGHLMHTTCFESYIASIHTRHESTHIRRLEPEDLRQQEFLCPLCKTLGNCLVPLAFPEAKEKVLWGNDMDAASYETQLEGWWKEHEDPITKSLAGPPSFEKALRAVTPEPGPLSWLSTARAATSLLSRFTDMLRSRRSDEQTTNIEESLAKHYFEHLIPHAWDGIYDLESEPDLEASDLMLLPETIYYTIAVLELATRGLPPPTLDGFRTNRYKSKPIHRIGVVDSMSSGQIMLLRQLCNTHDIVAEFMAQGRGSAQNPAIMARRALHTLLEGVLGPYQWESESGWEDGQEFEKQVWTAAHGGFWQVVGMSLFLKSSDVFGEDPRIMAGLSYVREVVRCCTVFTESILVKKQSWIHDTRVSSFATSPLPTEADPVLTFMSWLAQQLFDESQLGPDWQTRLYQINPQVVVAILERIMLVFLRRTAILFDARFKLIPAGGPNGFGLDKVDLDSMDEQEDENLDDYAAEKSESERLLSYLALPNVRDVFVLLTRDSNSLMHRLVTGWVVQIKKAQAQTPVSSTSTSNEGVHQPAPSTDNVDAAAGSNDGDIGPTEITNIFVAATTTTTTQTPAAGRRLTALAEQQHQEFYDDQSAMSLPSPLPFTLVTLPRRGEALLQESTRRICPNCKTLPSEPAICLLCGTTVCVQSMCCMETDSVRGECNSHLFHCGRDLGVFLIIKRAAVMVLRSNNRGCMVNSPYLDAHGEEDPGFRRGKPVFLNAKRYDELRKLVVSHGVSKHIARRLESIYDAGGWVNM
ncbi:hypothetical protein SmJEL517_g00734 [Synchytrium microbalum]|uniref:E3 ubiquitin-protein ligase n=1 Tax=Synchytrium microbalum TaxID=1806994 RepID=A0A507CIW2_9FUNG|nr:uncharacterized protein SmJEL517_g00734 [Synchytrium microbalum]TPX37695.1 hypothetical protein SmJEL517_g00734 [Synchytrium microbalum]